MLKSLRQNRIKRKMCRKRLPVWSRNLPLIFFFFKRILSHSPQPIGVSINSWPPSRHSREKNFIPAPLLIVPTSKPGCWRRRPLPSTPRRAPCLRLARVPFTPAAPARPPLRRPARGRLPAHQLLSARQAGATNDLRSPHPSALCTSGTFIF